ncbi:MAG: hypothetical protein HY674_21415 [Chloroflexi bacterium]|nr:hypothetical protein [Chloroflexota bacterium]
MAQLSHQARQAIEAEIRAGNKLQAIKLYRETVPGTGLAEAKQIVEGWEKHPPSRLAEDLTAPPRPGEGLEAQLLEQQREMIEAEILAGNKIQAIKLYREAVPGTGLAEAKQSIEEWELRLRVLAPGKFAALPKKGGCLGVLAGTAFLAGAAVAATILVLGE